MSPSLLFPAAFTCPPYSCLSLCLFQNVVELKVFDQDLLTKDDRVLSILFDVGTLRPGESRHESFSLSTQVKLCSEKWGSPGLGTGLWRLSCSRGQPRDPR